MLDARRKQYLEAMGLRLWVRRDLAAPESAGAFVPQVDEGVSRMSAAPPADPASAARAEVKPPESIEAPPEVPASSYSADWERLKRQVASCTACALHQSRTQTVFGVGDPKAALMVIGEAPGADEDRQGEPFVGRAGRLLTSMLAAIGLERDDVYIANILKCRPPGNRNPSPAEVACCMPYLEQQIALVKPRLILSLGGVSAHNLLGTDEPVGRLRGEVHRLGEAGHPVLVTYHPAYLLRQPADKAKVWQDLKRVKRFLEGDA